MNLKVLYLKAEPKISRGRFEKELEISHSQFSFPSSGCNVFEISYA